MLVKYLSAFALLAVLASPAAAQLAPPTPATQAAVASQAQRMAQELGLSADQHTRLRQVLLLTRQHMDADLKTHHDDPGALRTAMAFDRAKSDELIRGVLTPAQYVRYQQYKAARIGQLHSTSQVGR
jgi:Spy/CpxP family protein refolding chaperone